LKKEETEKEKKIRIGIPNNSIGELLKEFKSEEALEKMREHDINASQFWELSKDDLKNLLEIKIYGRLEKLTKRVNKIKKEHLKLKEKEHEKSKHSAKVM